MDDNRDRRGDQWVGVGYTTCGRCTMDSLVGLGSIRWRRKGQTHKRLANNREQRAKRIGRKGVDGEPMNIGYTAPKNVVCNRLIVVTLGRGERQWNPPKSGHCT